MCRYYYYIYRNSLVMLTLVQWLSCMVLIVIRANTLIIDYFKHEVENILQNSERRCFKTLNQTFVHLFPCIYLSECLWVGFYWIINRLNRLKRLDDIVDSALTAIYIFVTFLSRYQIIQVIYLFWHGLAITCVSTESGIECEE